MHHDCKECKTRRMQHEKIIYLLWIFIIYRQFKISNNLVVAQKLPVHRYIDFSFLFIILLI